MKPVGIDKETVTLNGTVFTHEEIHKVVDDFYTRIQSDPMLKVPFQSVHDWPDHVERLTQFWWIKFGGKPYMFSEYNPVQKHFFAGFNEVLLARWLELFHQVLTEHLNEPQVKIWKIISQRMGQALSYKNEMVKQNYTPKL